MKTIDWSNATVHTIILPDILFLCREWLDVSNILHEEPKG